MKLADLQKHSLQDRFVEREIKFIGYDEDTKNTKEFSATVFVRVSTTADAEILKGMFKDGESELAPLIHHNIRLGDGSDVIPLADAKNLGNSLAMALIDAINSVNQFETKKGKD